MTKRYLLAAIACGFLAVGLVSLTACPSSGQPANPVEQDFLSCAGIDISQPVAIGLTLVEDVTQIVEAGSNGWEAALAQLVLTYGNDALVCALKAAADTAAAHPPHIEPTKAALDAAARARSAMAKYAHGRTVK